MRSFKPELRLTGRLKRDGRPPAVAGGSIQANPADPTAIHNGGMETGPC